MTQEARDIQWMHRALQEAETAREEGEIPVGAVVVMQNRIIARGHNQTERLNDSTAHAEMIALTSAFEYMGAKYLPQATLYVTLEPCLMCSGALYWCKIGRVVFGASDNRHGFREALNDHSPFHPKTKVTGGILTDLCKQPLLDFFKEKRTLK